MLLPLILIVSFRKPEDDQPARRLEAELPCRTVTLNPRRAGAAESKFMAENAASARVRHDSSASFSSCSHASFQQGRNPTPLHMTALIVFHGSTEIEPHTTDIDVIPRRGDLLQIPSIGGRGLFPVVRVIFLMTRAQSGNLILSAPDDSPQVRIYLGVAQEE